MVLNAVATDNLLVTFLASFLIWGLFAALAVWCFWARKFTKKDFFKALFSTIIAWSLSQMVKNIIPSAMRPFKVNGFPPLTLTFPYDASFPSEHTAVAFALATYLWLKNKKLGAFFVVGAILVGIGRVAGNVHYPIDIMGGAILGIFSGLMVDSLLNRKSGN